MRMRSAVVVSIFLLTLTSTAVFAQGSGYTGSIDVVKSASVLTIGGLGLSGGGADGYGLSMDYAHGVSDRVAWLGNTGFLSIDGGGTTSYVGAGGMFVLRPSVIRDSSGALADRQFGAAIVAQSLSIFADAFNDTFFSGGVIADIPLGGYVSLRPNYMIFTGGDGGGDGQFGGDLVVRFSPGSTSDISLGSMIQQGSGDTRIYQLKYTKRFGGAQ
jgi:hypothetical protein